MRVSFRLKAVRSGFDIDVDFAADAGVIAIEGPSGAGKTTLLQGLAGLIPTVAARLAIDDRVVVDTRAGFNPPAHRRRIGFVFQEARLFPHLSVAANVGFGARFAARPMAVEAALDLVDLAGFGSRWPTSLSGGEIRRVAIARALCADPQMLFLDEPLSGLDRARREALTPYLRRLREETALPILLVSHDPRDIEALADVRMRIQAGRQA